MLKLTGIQGSQLWHTNRARTLITGSSVGQIINGSKINSSNSQYSNAYLELAIEKASDGKYRREFTGSNATNHGMRFEPLAKAFFTELVSGATLTDLPLCINSNLPNIGASPDGLVQYGDSVVEHLIEIKCPYSRQIDGTICPNYYHQMQCQLAICDKPMCYFLECEFKEVADKETWLKSESKFKFVFLSRHKWERDVPECIEDDELITYWHLTNHLLQEIWREADWYADHKKHFDEFITFVLELRKDNTWQEFLYKLKHTRQTWADRRIISANKCLI